MCRPSDPPPGDARQALEESPLAEPEDEVEVAVDDEDRAAIGPQAIAESARRQDPDGRPAAPCEVAPGHDRGRDLLTVAAPPEPAHQRPQDGLGRHAQAGADEPECRPRRAPWLMRRSGDDEAADPLRRAARNGHRDVAAERQPDEDGAPTGLPIDDVDDMLGGGL